MSTPMFALPNFKINSIKSDIDFDYIEFLLKKYKYSKLAVSGGTDPLSNQDKKINIEILRKIALDNKIRFFIYTKDNLTNKLYFIKYIYPSKLVVYNHLIADRNIEEIMAVSELCPTRLYIYYSNQHPVYINLWTKHFSKAKGVEFCIKQNAKKIPSKEIHILTPKIHVIAPGDYNYYIMPDNLLYTKYNAELPFNAGYISGKNVK